MKCTLIFFAALLLASHASSGAVQKPNIVHIHADDQRADGLRALGNPLLQTPNLDSLVERGMAFTHCYTMGSMVGAPARLRRGELWSLADQDGNVVARSSRVVEPVVFGAIDTLFPRTGPVRLIEIGCGSGTYIRHAASRNPALSALGLELQADVAEAARANLRAWGLEGRAQVEVGDVRERAPSREFDVATLHNNIYYFPVGERPALLAHVRRFLRPGGRLVLTTGCRGGGPTMHLLDLWAASTRGCGRLPEPAELEAQMREAGLRDVRSVRLMPGESYFAFAGDEPA